MKYFFFFSVYSLLYYYNTVLRGVWSVVCVCIHLCTGVNSFGSKKLFKTDKLQISEKLFIMPQKHYLQFGKCRQEKREIKLLKYGILQNQFSYIAYFQTTILKQANMFSLTGHSSVLCFIHPSCHF